MTQTSDFIEIAFPKLGHFWLDSGLVGLYKIATEIAENNPSYSHMRPKATDRGLIFSGNSSEIEKFLWECSRELMDEYFNSSSKNQRERVNAIIFSQANRRFERRPKRSPYGIGALIFNAKASDLHGRITVKKGEIIEDEEYKKFQSNLREFLSREGLKLTYDSKKKKTIPIDEPFYYRPVKEKDIKVGKPYRSKNNCFICGEEKAGSIEIGSPTFPLITGTSGMLSFNPQGGSPEKVCWKCSLLGKFVPVSGFYLKQGGHLFAFFPYSVSLEKMLDVFAPLHEAEQLDPNLFRNFEHPLGGYFQRPFEVTLAFLFTLYRKVLLQQKEEKEEINTVLDWERMCNLTLKKAPLEFIIMHTESKGQTFMVKMVWPFQDTVYFFRLMNELERAKINIRKVMQLLIPKKKNENPKKKNENKTLLRNRICERLLKKQTILDLVEAHIFRANLTWFMPLVDFLVLYEPIVRKGGTMTKKEQEVAVALGRGVGRAVGKDGKKGDLFALRKARKKTDFLEQLNRLQFKLGCNFTVPVALYEGSLTDTNFVEFKQFCMIAALNSFCAATKEGGKSK